MLRDPGAGRDRGGRPPNDHTMLADRIAGLDWAKGKLMPKRYPLQQDDLPRHGSFNIANLNCFSRLKGLQGAGDRIVRVKPDRPGVK